ncbi:D-alanine--D-alanine ligase [bacterium]|nr:D-alanine--D-alanine ligase [bacterium]
MDVGIAFDLRSDFTLDAGAPIDRLEEYDSEKTVQAIARALAENGHEPRLMGGGRRFLEAALARPPELVFNIAEGWGTRSREAHVPAVCEMLGIPFTHSDPLALALTLDKPLTKRVAASFGVPVAPFAVVETLDDLRGAALASLSYPLFVKPAAEGSSMGVRKSSRVLDRRALESEVERCLHDYKQPALVETFLPGIEFTVGVVGNSRPGTSSLEVIGVMEIEPLKVRPEEFVYGLETKRDYEVEVEYHVPPKSVTAQKRREVEQVALAAFRALGCRDVARFDMRLDERGVPTFMEVNPLPGLSPVSGDIVIISRARGWSYEKLIGTIVSEAASRQGLACASAPDRRALARGPV